MQTIEKQSYHIEKEPESDGSNQEIKKPKSRNNFKEKLAKLSKAVTVATGLAVGGLGTLPDKADAGVNSARQSSSEIENSEKTKINIHEVILVDGSKIVVSEKGEVSVSLGQKKFEINEKIMHENDWQELKQAAFKIRNPEEATKIKERCVSLGLEYDEVKKLSLNGRLLEFNVNHYASIVEVLMESANKFLKIKQFDHAESVIREAHKIAERWNRYPQAIVGETFKLLHTSQL